MLSMAMATYRMTSQPEHDATKGRFGHRLAEKKLFNRPPAIVADLRISSLTTPNKTLAAPHTHIHTSVQTCGSSHVLLALNHLVTWFLSFNVLYNFAASFVCGAGGVRECCPLPTPQQGQPVPKVSQAASQRNEWDGCSERGPPTQLSILGQSKGHHEA